MSASRKQLTRADEARAHRLGYRARSHSFELALRFAVVGAAFAWLSSRGASLAATWGALLPRGVETDALAGVRHGGVLLGQTLVYLCLVLGLGAIASAWLTRNFGPTRGAGAPVSVAPSWGRALMAFAVGGFAWVLFRGVVAGAARGSGASLEGLGALWDAWALRTPLLLSALLGAAGVLEWILARQRARQVYAQSLEQGEDAVGGKRS